MRRLTLCYFLIAAATAVLATDGRRPVVLAADLGTESARAAVVDAENGRILATHAVPYDTFFPQPGHAEQEPTAWWDCLGQACRACLDTLVRAPADAPSPSYVVRGLSVDTTACSVVALDAQFRPLRRCLLWCDARSAPQCKRILELGRGDAALNVNCGGAGPLSAEWMIPKALWLKENEPDTWARAAVVCEKQDYVNFLLTGRLVASGCNVAARWHWDADAACAPGAAGTDEGRPVSLLRRVGLEDLLGKWPREAVGMGEPLGPLTRAAAAHLGLLAHPALLPASAPAADENAVPVTVTQGGPDAYVGMLGLGCVRPGQLALITGSSHLHLAVCGADASAAPGVWGPYQGAPLPSLRFAEGGQSSTGSALAWFRRILNTVHHHDNHHHHDAPAKITSAPAHVRSTPPARRPPRKAARSEPPAAAPAPSLSYAELDAEAAAVPVGAGGLLAVETFQGSRTPVTDAEARGALLGLTLSHTRAHVWRALLEAVCLGTRAALEALDAAGITAGATELLVAGGATRSPLWLQMHSDATGLPVAVGEVDNAPLLGAAILAAVGAGCFDDAHADADLLLLAANENGEGDATQLQRMRLLLRRRVERAAGAMVRRKLRVEPDPAAKAAYDRLFPAYRRAVAAARDVSHALADLRSGAAVSPSSSPATDAAPDAASPPVDAPPEPCHLPSGREALAVPSILAADFGALAAEAAECLAAGARWLHVDVCDGSPDAGHALTLYVGLRFRALFQPLFLTRPRFSHRVCRGPQAVAALHRAAPALLLDAHVVAHHADALAPQLAAAGAARVTFQLEVELAKPEGAAGALALARAIRAAGARCGVCVAPGTSEALLAPLLRAWHAPGDPLVDLVDVLAVAPGVGGQRFDDSVLAKVRAAAPSPTLCLHASSYPLRHACAGAPHPRAVPRRRGRRGPPAALPGRGRRRHRRDRRARRGQRRQRAGRGHGRLRAGPRAGREHYPRHRRRGPADAARRAAAARAVIVGNEKERSSRYHHF
jgi:pentose-5-phosphate-3-epimerase